MVFLKILFTAIFISILIASILCGILIQNEVEKYFHKKGQPRG